MDIVKHQILGLGSSDGASIKPAKLSNRGRVTRAGHQRLLTRGSLDGRTSAAKTYDALIGAIVADMGGADRCSTLELSLIEDFAGSKVILDHLHTRVLSGAPIDAELVAMHAAEINAQVKLAAKLGLQRRAKLVPDLDTFLALRARARGEPPKSEVVG